MNPFFMQLAAPSGLRRWFLNYEKIWLEIKRGVSLRLSFWGSPSIEPYYLTDKQLAECFLMKLIY
jgi:hypothetical protein